MVNKFIFFIHYSNIIFHYLVFRNDSLLKSDLWVSDSLSFLSNQKETFNKGFLKPYEHYAG